MAKFSPQLTKLLQYLIYKLTFFLVKLFIYNHIVVRPHFLSKNHGICHVILMAYQTFQTESADGQRKYILWLFNFNT